MRPHYIIVALAVLVAPPARAACTDVTDVAVVAMPDNGSMSGRVEYNPFVPTNAALSIRATYDAPCDTAHDARIFFPVTGGTIADFPELEVRSGGTVVYRTNAAYGIGNTQGLGFRIVGAGASTGVANLTAVPVAQDAPETAFSPTGSQTLDIDVVFEMDGGSSVSRSVGIPVETIVQRTIALTNSFAMGETEQRTEFAAIDGTGQSIQKKLFLWSNDGFKITASSLNGGIMMRDGGAGGSADINSVPYTLTISTGSGVLLRLDTNAAPNIAVETGTLAATIVDGNRYDILVDIAANEGAGKRAGSYRDTVTLTIAPPI